MRLFKKNLLQPGFFSSSGQSLSAVNVDNFSAQVIFQILETLTGGHEITSYKTTKEVAIENNVTMLIRYV